MNRSFVSRHRRRLRPDGAVGEDKDYGEHREIQADDVAELLADASSVVITPGYGMAVAQAQYPVAELTASCARRASTYGSASTPSPVACPGT